MKRAEVPVLELTGAVDVLKIGVDRGDTRFVRLLEHHEVLDFCWRFVRDDDIDVSLIFL